MKTNTMKTIVRNGIASALNVGELGVFYANQFCYSRQEWNAAFDKAAKALDSYWGDNPLGGRAFTKEVDNYVYLYILDCYGDWESVAFTHKVIAGDIRR